jgi:thiamine biosynthesis lipoprotein
MLIRIALFCLLLLCLNACTEKNTIEIEFKGQTMGTLYNISLVSPANSSLDKKKLKKDITQILSNINQQMSTYIVDSEISRFNQAKSTNWFLVSNDLLKVVNAAQQVSELSEGFFDITITPLIDLWGFGPDIKLKIPDKHALQEAKRQTGFQLLETKQSPPALRKKKDILRIDLSAIAKGFAVDKISQYLSGQGLNNHLVEIGGEIRVSGTNQENRKWRVAIESPNTKTETFSNVMGITNQAVATSGDYRNYYIVNGNRRSHIINPKTGEPIRQRLASVTVRHGSAMMADAFATALMVMGEDRAKRFAKEQDLSVYMLIREQEKFTVWETIP